MLLVTHHTSHITHHTSHITHHTSHITHHTSHITHHTSPVVVLSCQCAQPGDDEGHVRVQGLWHGWAVAGDGSSTPSDAAAASSCSSSPPPPPAATRAHPPPSPPASTAQAQPRCSTCHAHASRNTVPQPHASRNIVLQPHASHRGAAHGSRMSASLRNTEGSRGLGFRV